jgi:pimeloyl-ACP methyl ester carboxylesterase
MAPQTRYARSGDVNIAYQVVGDGPIDLVFVMGWVSNIDHFWEEPGFARFLQRLASFTRLIVFDKRGTGLSDRVPIDRLPTLEERMDDVRAVMDAAGSRRAALMGVSEGGPLCILFGATYPERTQALVLVGSYAHRLYAPDYPWGRTEDEAEEWIADITASWGGPVGLDLRAPSAVDDERFREWWAAYLRASASPGAAAALTRMNLKIECAEYCRRSASRRLCCTRRGTSRWRSSTGATWRSTSPGRGT